MNQGYLVYAAYIRGIHHVTMIYILHIYILLVSCHTTTYANVNALLVVFICVYIQLGMTPLHLAAKNGDLPTVRVLLESGKCETSLRDHVRFSLHTKLVWLCTLVTTPL